jgi:transposase InsO family protein
VYRSYDFPGARDQVNQIIKNCDVCNKAKPVRYQPYGELQPLPVPKKPWDVVTMDFVVKLPKSCEPMTEVYFDSIAVIVDKLIKYAYFILYRKVSIAKELAYMFFKIVASQHGLPQQIITDRDKLFTSKFWQTFMEQLKIGHKLSTAYHPQIDGQTERTNQTFKQYLRCYVNYEQNDWVQWLPTAQWVYNSATIEATSKTSFEANYRYNPTMRMVSITVNVE